MSAKRQLSEAEAFREIARKVDESEMDLVFMCLLTDAMQRARRISGATSFAMHERIKDHLNGAWTYNRAVWWESGETWSTWEAKEARVLAALFLALEAEDEASERAS